MVGNCKPCTERDQTPPQQINCRIDGRLHKRFILISFNTGTKTFELTAILSLTLQRARLSNPLHPRSIWLGS
jgi:hypothetical protein